MPCPRLHPVVLPLLDPENPKKVRISTKEKKTPADSHLKHAARHLRQVGGVRAGPAVPLVQSFVEERAEHVDSLCIFF